MYHVSRILFLLPGLFAFFSTAPIDCVASDWGIHSEPWPEADRLFRRDSRWRGSDAANSIDLGNNRVLWTFGDSFVDTNEDPAQRNRKNAVFIRNSIAIQVGYDPTCAEFQPYWQVKEEGTPSSFFRSEGKVYYWPAGGLMLDGNLLLFLMRVRNSSKKLGFSIAGWGAVLIANPLDSPRDWKMNFIKTPQNSHGIIVGSGSSIRVGKWIYSFGAASSMGHSLYLTRILVADAIAGYFSKLEWWNRAGKDWRKQAEIEKYPPPPIVDRGQTEFTVHYEPRLHSYLLTQFESFPKSPIAIRHAQELTGPWSPMRAVVVPEEADISWKDTMVYSAKAHPEQVAKGLAVTYCTNTFHFATVRTNESIYYPRFIRIVINNQAGNTAETQEVEVAN